VAIVLDEQVRFFPNSASSGTGVTAESLSPGAFFPFFQICTAKGQPTGGKVKKEK
jgi:hypothetical protein